MNDGEAALPRFGNLQVRWVAALRKRWQRPVGENPLHRRMTDPAIVPPPTDLRDLVRPEGWIFRLQREDAMPDIGRDAAASSGASSVDGKRLAIPSASKRSALRPRVRSETPVAAARSAAVWPKRTIGRSSSSVSCSGKPTERRGWCQSSVSAMRCRLVMLFPSRDEEIAPFPMETVAIPDYV